MATHKWKSRWRRKNPGALGGTGTEAFSGFSGVVRVDMKRNGLPGISAFEKWTGRMRRLAQLDSVLTEAAVPTALIAGARKVFVRLMNFCTLELPAGA
jgi:hypothetical protein